MMALQVNFSTEQFSRQTQNRIEQSIRSNECNLRTDQRINDANKSPNDLEIAITRINELTAQIRSFNDYDGLRGIVTQHLSDLRQDIDEKIKEKSKLLEKIGPLTKLPKNPLAVVRFIKKLVFKDILPLLQAIIKMALQIVRLLQALNALQLEIRRALDRLEEFVKSLPDFVVTEAQRTIDQAVISLQVAIQDKIVDAICGELKKENVSIEDARNALSLIQQAKAAIQQIDALAQTVSTDLNSSLSTISTIQGDIVSETGQTPSIDTSSSEAFLQSVESGAADDFISGANDFANNLDADAGVTNIREFNVVLAPPLQNSNVAFGTISTANGFIAADFSDWAVAKQLAEPTANLVFNVTVNDVSKGNVTITTTGAVISNTGNTQIDLLPNDIINLVTPANASTAAANTRVYFTIKINELGTGTP